MPTADDAVKTGREGDVKDPRVVSFRMPLWRWLLVGIPAAQVGGVFFLVLLDVVFDQGRGLRTSSFWSFYTAGAVAIVTLIVPALLAYVLVWRVWVGPATLRGSDFWGRFVTVSWRSVHAVRPLSVPFLPVLRVHSTETRRVIWLPLFLVNYRRFAELVAEYAGADHPVTRAVWQRIEDS
jgi:hypothetical protein